MHPTHVELNGVAKISTASWKDTAQDSYATPLFAQPNSDFHLRCSDGHRNNGHDTSNAIRMGSTNFPVPQPHRRAELDPLRVRCHRMVMLGRQHHIVWYLRKHDGSTDHWYDQMTITVGLNDGSVRISATHLLKNTAGFGKDVVRSSKRWLSPIQKHADACDCEHRQAQCWL